MEVSVLIKAVIKSWGQMCSSFGLNFHSQKSYFCFHFMNNDQIVKKCGNMVSVISLIICLF